MMYQKFENNLLALTDSNKIATSVSGGIDSMIMLHMLMKFSAKFNKEIYAITIDHNLRATSKQDAEFVYDYCAQNNVKCEILTWEHDNNLSNIQANAREARYSLMTDFCKKNDIDILLTAHHADDQIENLFIKLSRGASIYSLAQNITNIYNDVNILRPMHNIFKNEIEKYAEEYNINFVYDESNDDTKYLRNEIRQKLKIFFEDSKHLSSDMFKQRIMTSIGNITRATNSLKELVKKCKNECFTFSENNLLLNRSIYKRFMQEEQMQALTEALQEFSGNENNIRMDSLTMLYQEIIENENFTLTLHGCIIKRKQDQVIISREETRY